MKPFLHLLLRRRLFLCLFFLTSNLLSFPQRVLQYEQFTSEKGLSENVVYTLYKDRKGFIWAGTDHGLNRFDGYSFKKFLMNRDDSSTLSSSGILSIAESGDGKLWVGTYTGLNLFDPQTEKAERIKIPGKGINYGIMGKIRVLQDSQVFFASSYHEYYIVDEHSMHVDKVILPGDYYAVSGDLFMIPGNKYGVIVKSRSLDKTVLAVLNEKEKKWELQPVNNLFPFISDVLPSWFYSDEYGFCFLFYSAEGLLEIFNKEGKNILQFRFRQKKTDAALQVFDVATADASSVWITTNYGVHIFNRNAAVIESTELKGDSKSLPGNKEIRCLLNDDKGSIWMGVFGEGILRYDNRVQAFRNMALPEITGESLFRMIFGLHTWGGDTVAAETGYTNFILIRQGEVVKRITQKELTAAETVRITTGKQWKELSSFQQETITALYRSGSLFPFRFVLHNDTTLILNSDQVFIYRPSGVVRGNANTTGNIQVDNDYYWVAAASGLYRINKKDFSEKVYRHEAGDPFSLSETFLYHCLMDEKKNLWIGTKGGGLNYFDRQQEKFYHYTTADGLTDDVVYCIVPDKAGNIWLTTNRGISRFNIAAKTFTNFSRRDGLLNSEFNRQGGIYNIDGHIYLSGTSGLDYFNPGEIESPETPSAVSFSEVKVNDNKIIPDRADVLDYSQNSFFFSFTANDFIRPDLVYYRYRISNKEKWTQVRGVNTALYSALTPGQYNFEVQASYDNLNWSKSLFYSFTIKQPWWKTKAFIISAVLFIITALWLLYRYRINQLKKVHRLRSKISQDLHDEVGATLSSIHVYSSVAAKAMNRDAGKAIDALEHINSNARQVMENMSDIVWAINTGDIKETTLEGKLKNYGYDLLTPLNIKCDYRIDREAEKKLVNMEARKNILLIAKEAMNNIAKHSGATEASVHLHVTGKHLLLEIADNGHGNSEREKTTGNGMINMRRRAEAMGGSFGFASENEKGSRLLCRIPLTTISD